MIGHFSIVSILKISIYRHMAMYISIVMTELSWSISLSDDERKKGYKAKSKRQCTRANFNEETNQLARGLWTLYPISHLLQSRVHILGLNAPMVNSKQKWVNKKQEKLSLFKEEWRREIFYIEALCYQSSNAIYAW